MIGPPDGDVNVTIDVGQGHADLGDPAVRAMLAELRARVSLIEIRASNPSVITMSGPGEVGLLIAVVGLAAFVKRFGELLADDAHELIRKGINRLRSGRADKAGVVRFGSLDFHFSGELSDTQMSARFRAASNVVREAPDFAVEGPTKNLSGLALEAGMTPGFSWDEERGMWVPDAYLAKAIGIDLDR